MKILKSNLENTEIGLTFKNSAFQILFGNKNSSVENIKNAYPQLHLQKIKQTHSDIVVQSSNATVEADGHFSSEKKTGLLISTADCLPVLIFCSQTKRVASVHAGWKGVANQIVLKTLRRFVETGSTQKIFELWIGPHILQNSFEIELDVLKQLAAASYGLNQSEYCNEKNSKFYVDLNQIVISQIAQIADKKTAINFVEVDTKTNLDYWSFRRDKDKAGRNLSFISIL